MAVLLLRKKNYLAMIQNIVRGENHLFRNTYALLEDREGDITKAGQFSSGKLVSSILYLNDLIGAVHVTIEGTERDMQEHQWRQGQALKPGAVIIWEPVRGQAGNLHTHIGFVVDSDQAVSNNEATGLPELHHATYGQQPDGQPVRRILRCYTHPVLEGE